MAFNVQSNANDSNAVTSALAQSLPGATGQNYSDFLAQTNAMGDKFNSLFKTFVGRDPTAEEQSQFVNQYIVPNVGQLRTGTSGFVQDPYTYLNQFISNTFQPQAKDFATQQLQQQQSQAQDLANQYRTMGQQAINSTSQQLQDYDQQLFNRLQPQILMSMQSQGLLNTGGLNEALAGAQKDLAAQAQGYLADANLQMQNQANQIAFGGASAPYQYQQANIMNQLPYLQSQGANASNSAYNTFLNNLNFQNQMALQNNYFKNMNDMQPSFLRTLGQSFAGSFGKQSGESAAQMPFAAMQAFGSGGLSSFGAAMP